jgi:microsomal dipeptidase-like Zn-dependent dipeptidase
MNTFDLHFHPLFKRYLTKFDDADRHNDQATLPVRLPRVGSVIDALAGRILENQSSVAQTLAGKPPAAIRMGVAAVLALEYVFASRQGLLRLLELKVWGREIVASLDSRFIDFVNQSQGSYAQLLDKELAFYQWVAAESARPGTRLAARLNLLSRKRGQPLADQLLPDQLNLALAIEGGHSLSQRIVRQLAGPYDPVAQVRRYRAAPTVDFLYLTLTHLSHIPEQQLCSHAYGFKLVKNVPDARPQFGGLTALGREVVRACVDTQANAYPILIDLKHMSARGRDVFFAYRRELLAQKPAGFVPPGPADSWPILATHMGVTGFRRQQLRLHLVQHGLEAANPFSVRLRFRRERAGQFREGLFKENVFFNAASIGLYDEDIEEIAHSGGLIGLSLDSRILGYQNLIQRTGADHDYDYFSREDFATYFPDLSQPLPKLAEEEEAPAPPAAELLSQALSQDVLGQAGRRTRELYLFCLNALHIVAVVQAMHPAAPRAAWSYLCLGSDYDGVIDSMQAARTVELLPSFRQESLDFFPEAEAAYRRLRPTVSELLPRVGGSTDVAPVLEGLFYGNGRQFLQDWWG